MIKQHYHVAKLQFQIESVGRQAALVISEGVVHGHFSFLMLWW